MEVKRSSYGFVSPRNLVGQFYRLFMAEAKSSQGNRSAYPSSSRFRQPGD